MLVLSSFQHCYPMKKLSRRSFVKSTAAASAGLMVVPHMMSYSPAKKLNLAFIGVGGRGGRNIKSCDIKTKKGVATNNIVALCDVSDERAANGYKAYPNAKRFTDFRKMFDQMGKEIDAVVVSTPDHTHFAATMAAMELGKHVYVEKPLAHNVWQLRTLKKAEKHYGVITQMGNQGHTTDGIRKVKEWYDAGVLGEVKEVVAWFNGPQFSERGYFLKPKSFPVKGSSVPKGLDWDSWLGPASDRPYSRYYLPRFWRSWYELGNGLLGDWACHTLDAPFWSLGLGMPAAVDSVYRSPTPVDKGFISDSSRLLFHFPKRGDQAPVKLHWYEGGLKPASRPEWHRKDLPNSGMIMIGSKASLMTGGRPNKPELLLPEKEWKEFQRNMPKATIPRVAEEDPQGEWIRAMKEEGPMPGSPFSYGADLTEMALIGVMAQRFGVRIEYDAKNMKVTNHKDFDQYIKEPVREGWVYGENL